MLQFFGEPSLGKPEQDAKKEVEWVKDWIDKAAPEDDIPVLGVVVFTHDNIELDVEGAPLPIVGANELAEQVKEGFKGGRVLTTAKQKELRRLFDEVIAEQ